MKKIIIIIIILFIGGAGTAWYLYTKPVADMNDLKAEHSLSAVELFNAYVEDEAAANTNYLGKIIEIAGKVRELKSDNEGYTIILETDDMIFGVNCGLSSGQEEAINMAEVGKPITIRGECTGISMDVVLVRCVIVETN